MSELNSSKEGFYLGLQKAAVREANAYSMFRRKRTIAEHIRIVYMNYADVFADIWAFLEAIADLLKPETRAKMYARDQIKQMSEVREIQAERKRKCPLK